MLLKLTLDLPPPPPRRRCYIPRILKQTRRVNEDGDDNDDGGDADGDLHVFLCQSFG